MSRGWMIALTLGYIILVTYLIMSVLFSGPVQCSSTYPC